MISNDTIVEVTNRSGASVGYTVPDLGIRREFSHGEKKEITANELRKLSYRPGGKYIIEHCLFINNDNLVRELLGQVEPEYSYTENDIQNLLEHGSLEEFLDCLDFAPDGVIDLIQKISVKIELNDVRKRDAILKKTGFNVTKAILANQLNAEDGENADEPAQRRVQPNIAHNTIESEGGTSRRTTPPKYKVVGR